MAGTNEVDHIGVSYAGQDGNLTLKELPECCLAGSHGTPAVGTTILPATAALCAAATACACILLIGRDSVVKVQHSQPLDGNLHRASISNSTDYILAYGTGTHKMTVKHTG